MRKYFLDANIILDLIDLDRDSVDDTKKLIEHLLINGDSLYTSCDIFTTVYYIASKKIDYSSVVEQLEKILTFVDVIPIDIHTITEAIEISKKEKKKDLEDLLQYVCGKNSGCEVIITNDKGFYSGELEVFSVRDFLSNKE